MAMVVAIAMSMVMAMTLAVAMAAATAAVIRPEHAEGGRNDENRLFIETRGFTSILAISGSSRPQKWIRLEKSGRMVLSGGLETQNKGISWEIYLSVSILA